MHEYRTNEVSLIRTKVCCGAGNGLDGANGQHYTGGELSCGGSSSGGGPTFFGCLIPNRSKITYFCPSLS